MDMSITQDAPMFTQVECTIVIRPLAVIWPSKHIRKDHVLSREEMTGILTGPGMSFGIQITCRSGPGQPAGAPVASPNGNNGESYCAPTSIYV